MKRFGLLFLMFAICPQRANAASLANGPNVAAISSDGYLSMSTRAADLIISATGASGAAVTATLPAVPGKFHYIAQIEITMYAALARIGGATPVVVTTTNLPGSLSFSFDSVQAIGASVVRTTPTTVVIKSLAANTATTIVCPATTSVIWRVNVYYYVSS